VDSSVVWPHMLLGSYQCVYGALFGITPSMIPNSAPYTHIHKDRITYAATLPNYPHQRI
jgi:hypothetical protein